MIGYKDQLISEVKIFGEILEKFLEFIWAQMSSFENFINHGVLIFRNKNNHLWLITDTVVWCGRRDSNSYASRRWNLNPVRLPISPLPL